MVAAVFGLALCAHGAQAPQHVNINQLSTTVEDVVVPLPNEIFGALNKLGAVNWKEHVRSDERTQFHRATAYRSLAWDSDCRWLYRGASGGCACSKRYWPARPGTGQGDRRRNSITPHAKAIIDAADKRNWANVRQELDRTPNSVQ